MEPTKETEFSWGSNQYTWSNNPYTWGDCQLIINIVKSGGGIVEEWKIKDEKKYKQVIKLWCKVKGYDETYYQKEKKNIKLSTHDINFMVAEVSKYLVSIFNVK